MHLLQEEHPSLDAFLFAPSALKGPTAVQLAVLACRIEPKIQTIWTETLLRQLEQLSESEVLEEVLRRMEVLAVCADRLRFAPLLQKLSAHSHAKIRSKAAVLSPLLYDLCEDVPALNDENARVRANALESMWGRSDPKAIEVFKANQGRSSNREAINAVLGLHFAGELSARRRLMELAASDNSRIAASAIWAMGMTKDPRLLCYLQSRLKQSGDAQQMGMLRSARRIKAFQEAAEALPPLTLRPIRLEWLGLGQMQVSLLLLNSLGQPCDPRKNSPRAFHGARRRSARGPVSGPGQWLISSDRTPLSPSGRGQWIVFITPGSWTRETKRRPVVPAALPNGSYPTASIVTAIRLQQQH